MPRSQDEGDGETITRREVELRLRNLSDGIDALETRLDERASALKLAVDNTSDVFDERIKTIRVELDNIRSDIADLKKSKDYGKGRDTTIGNTIALAVAVGAIVIELIRTLTGH